jgi:hypothetical protein
VISGIGFEEGEPLTTDGGVDDLVYPREWEIILQLVLVQRSEVNTHAIDLGVFLFNHHRR